MKKKIIAFLIAVAAGICLCSGLAACDGCSSCNGCNGKDDETETVIPEHVHSYDKEVVEDKYKKSDATCTAKAVYYYSCSVCGARGDETFESGDPLEHTGGTATCTHKAVCTRCGESYGELNAGNHAGVEEWSDTATQHTRIWSCCHVTVTAATDHSFTNGVCSTCGYVCPHETISNIYKCTVCDYDEKTDLKFIANDETNPEYYYVSAADANIKSAHIPATYNNKPVYVADKGFEGCTSLKSVIIDDGVKEIGSYAFSSCISLASVKLGSGLERIGNDAFGYCYALTNITIPESVTSIAGGAFHDCYKLIEVCNLSDLHIVKGVSDTHGGIAANARNLYSGTSGASKIHTTDDGYVFYIDGTNVYLMGYVGADTEISLPESYNDGTADYEYEIYNYAFYNNTSIKSVIIPEIIQTIGYKVFFKCSSLVSVTLPNSLMRIESHAFESCTMLMSITIPKNVNYVGENAFRSCYRLVELCNLSSLDLGGSSDKSQIKYYNLDSYNTREYRSKLVTKDGYVFYEYDGSTVYLIGYTGTEKALTLPSNYNNKTYKINTYAFYKSDITSVAIGDGVTAIETYAFKECYSLTSVTMGSGVTSIAWYAFEDCTSLTSVTLGSNVNDIGESAFSNCRALKSIAIPDKVTRIEANTFDCCQELESIVIGKGMTRICNYALEDCAKLASVYYNGTEEQWTADVTVEDNANLNATVYYYSENEPNVSGNYWHYVGGVSTVWSTT